MDILNILIFKNKYLFNHILNLISCNNNNNNNHNNKYKKLNQFDLSVIFSNRKLFNLKYQSYIYNKENHNNHHPLIFKDINKYAKEFFGSLVINIEEFKIIYNDYKNELSRYSTNKILQFCILNQDYHQCKERIQYLVDYQSFQFDIHQFNLYFKLWFKSVLSVSSNSSDSSAVLVLGSNSNSNSNSSIITSTSDNQIKLLYFIIHCFKYYSYNKLYIGKTQKTTRYIKQFKANVQFKYLIQCIEQSRENLYKPIFDLCELLDEDGNDILIKKCNRLVSKRSFLIQKIIMHGSKLLATIYCTQYPNQRCPNLSFTQNAIHPNTNKQDSIDSCNILSSNNTIPAQEFHYGYFMNKYNSI